MCVEVYFDRWAILYPYYILVYVVPSLLLRSFCGGVLALLYYIVHTTVACPHGHHVHILVQATDGRKALL